MVFIYILKLKDNKYYIGKTDNPKFRLDNHFKASGSSWTTKYKPIQIIGLFPDCDDFDEDKYTLKYMKKYGIENVRGGSFCKDTLSSETLLTIKKMICGAKDNCYECGKPGHFAKDCPRKIIKDRIKANTRKIRQVCFDYFKRTFNDIILIDLVNNLKYVFTTKIIEQSKQFISRMTIDSECFECFFGDNLDELEKIYILESNDVYIDNSDYKIYGHSAHKWKFLRYKIFHDKRFSNMKIPLDKLC